MLMKLLYAPQSPYARKVRAAAIELGLDGEMELEYVEAVPGRPNRGFRETANPLGKIPALITRTGETIFDSTVICEYLDQLAGGGTLFPHGRDRWRVLSNHALAQGMCDAILLIRYETWLRPDTHRWPTWIDEQWDKIWSGLAWFDAHPDQLGSAVNISHLALGSLIGYMDFRFSETSWRQRFPVVASWFADLTQRPSFARTVPSQPGTHRP